LVEVIVLVLGTRWLASAAKKRGQSPFLSALFPAMWIGGEIFGTVTGFLVSSELLVAVLCGWLAALAGGLVAVAVVFVLPPRDPKSAPSVPGAPPDEVRENVWTP